MERLENMIRDFVCVKDFLLERGSCLEVSDWVAIKTCLLSLGILLGSGFSNFFKKLRPLLTVVTFITGAFAALRIFAPVFDNLKDE